MCVRVYVCVCAAAADTLRVFNPWILFPEASLSTQVNEDSHERGKTSCLSVFFTPRNYFFCISPSSLPRDSAPFYLNPSYFRDRVYM